MLRNNLLRIPLGLDLFDEDLSAENGLFHFGGFDGDELVAYLQLKPTSDSVLKMQQVAVAEALQGGGIGRKLVELSEEFARENDFTRMVLHAREAVIGFYELLGYQREGERFLEVGIAHFKASKALL